MQSIPKLITVMALAVCIAPALLGSLPAVAGGGETAVAGAANSERTVVFAIEKMTCAACPLTVRKAMQGVAGVKSVDVDFDAKTATVVFDPALATPEQIAAASTHAGYPAAPIS